MMWFRPTLHTSVSILISVLLAPLGLLLTNNAAAADVVNGKQLFNQCVACHMVGEDAQHRFGPALTKVLDQPAGVASGYEYSAALKSAAAGGLVWTEESLNDFLKAPMQDLPGTKMAYPGLAEESDRLDMIAYLGTLGEPVAEDTKTKTDAAVEADVPRTAAADAVIPEHGVLHLGREALPEEITAWDIDVRPDGQGLPQGSGNAIDGGALYDAQCASCHGVFGEGEGRWPILAGGFDTLTEERPEKTIGSYWPYLSTVYDYVKRAMPFGNARSLSDDDVYAITAYLLYLNDLADEDFELSSENFASIRLPNEANFYDDDRAQEPGFKASAEPCMTDCIPGEATVSMRARVLDVTPDEQ